MMADTASPTEKQAPAIEAMARAIHDADPKTATEGRWDDVWVHESWRERAREAARDALAALAASGFVIVPREPTAEMIEAHIEECAGDAGEAGPDRIRSCWRAMVDASPWINHAAGR
jgi:hypothetical protein